MPSAVASRIESIRRHGGIRTREVADLLDTTTQTVWRWQQGKAEPQPDRLQRLLTLDWLVSELSEFYRPDEARLWLLSPHKLLQGQRPSDKIRENRVEEVLALIAQLRDSAYV